jgi:hypothetical protein
MKNILKIIVVSALTISLALPISAEEQEKAATSLVSTSSISDPGGGGH